MIQTSSKHTKPIDNDKILFKSEEREYEQEELRR